MFNAWGMNLEKRLLLSTADLNANIIWLVGFYCVEETGEPGEKNNVLLQVTDKLYVIM